MRHSRTEYFVIRKYLRIGAMADALKHCRSSDVRLVGGVRVNRTKISASPWSINELLSGLKSRPAIHHGVPFFRSDVSFDLNSTAFAAYVERSASAPSPLGSQHFLAVPRQPKTKSTTGYCFHSFLVSHVSHKHQVFALVSHMGILARLSRQSPDY